jgi:hypothetical protein
MSIRRVAIRIRQLKSSLDSSFARLWTALLVQASEVPYTETSRSTERKVSLSPKPELSHKERREVRKVGWPAWHTGGGKGDIAEGLLGDANETVIRDCRRTSASGIMLEE